VERLWQSPVPETLGRYWDLGKSRYLSLLQWYTGVIPETRSGTEAMASLLCPRIPGDQMRETLKALDDVMVAKGASAQDDLAKHIGSSRIAIL
jgi:hypothetical protein